MNSWNSDEGRDTLPRDDGTWEGIIIIIVIIVIYRFKIVIIFVQKLI